MFRLRSAALLAGAAVAFAAMAAGLAACPTTVTNTAYTPITGILIRSSSLVAGLGCGTAPGQVYRYAAVVKQGDTPVISGVFDCFTDGLFENLLTDGGGAFTVDIYAWDQGGFPPALNCGYTDGGCPGDTPGTVLNLVGGDPGSGLPPAQWVTKPACTATPQQGITVLAVCPPLAVNPQPPSILLDLSSVGTADGGTLQCGTDYTQATVGYDDGLGMMGSFPAGPCQNRLRINPATVGADYKFTAPLTVPCTLDDPNLDPRLAADTTCGATTIANQVVEPTCIAKLGPRCADVTVDTKDGFPIADAGDSGPMSVACNTDYDTVNAFYSDGIHMPTQSGERPCDAGVLIAPAFQGATYDIQLYLLKNNAAVWRSDCSAVANANTVTRATCAPVNSTTSLPDAGSDGGDGGSDAGDAGMDANDAGATDALSDAADATMD